MSSELSFQSFIKMYADLKQRDWIPVLVGPITSAITYDLTQVNAVNARIDQIVSLVAPSLLPLIMAFFGDRTGWISLLVGITVLLWIAEVWIARQIAAENAELREPKKPSHDLASIEDPWPTKLYYVLYQDPALRLRHFFSIPMWPASISTSLLHLTVLAYSATMITCAHILLS
jgi:iron-regulated transporter 1